MSADPKLSASEDLYALLPWHANSTLRGPEAARLDAALAADPALRATLERVREERDETVLFNQSIEGASASGLAALMDRIETEAPRRAPAAGLLSRIADAIGIRPGVLALAAVAAALVLIAGSSAITQFVSRDVPAGRDYITASVEPVGPVGQAVLVVSFVPDASIDAVGKLLRSQKATIIEGPVAGSLYRIEVASADAETVLAALKDRADLVAFAAPGQAKP